ncbi:hypothetical protein V8E51_010867 [Hyaloscypha variabilis]
MFLAGNTIGRPCYSCFQATEDILTRGVRHLNFKNGAFVTSVTSNSSVADCIDVLCASSRLLPSEKQILQECLEQYIELCSMPSTTRAGFRQLFVFMTSVNTIWEIFKADAESRGLDAPPMYFEQVFAVMRQRVIDAHFPKSREDDNAHFGEEFGKNLRGGFM